MITLDKLDRPIICLEQDVIFNCIEFYDDFYTVIHLQIIDINKQVYHPIIINDKELMAHYQYINMNSITNNDYVIHSPVYKIKWDYIQFANGLYGCYIEKHSIWDFLNIGIILILCYSQEILKQYIETNFLLYKRKKFVKNNKLLKL